MSKKAKPTRENAKPTEADLGADVSGLRWDDLQVLLALSRAGTLSGAAVRLQVNTSTVARRLDAMEEGLGLHLFDRTPSGIAATEMAEALLPVAEAMERAAADGLRLIAGRETLPEGVVRVTAPPGLANWLIAPALEALHQRYPGLVIELDASVGYANLTRREADIALRGVRPLSGDLVAVRLAEAESIIAAAPSLVARVGRLRSLHALPWINWGRDLAHLPDARWINDHVRADRIVLRTSSMDAQLHAARAGLGALLVPMPFVRCADLAPVVCARPLARSLPELPRGALWMVGHRALRNVPRIEAVWDFLVEQAHAWAP